jgi:hypothetical protein
MGYELAHFLLWVNSGSGALLHSSYIQNSPTSLTLVNGFALSNGYMFFLGTIEDFTLLSGTIDQTSKHLYLSRRIIGTSDADFFDEGSCET